MPNKSEKETDKKLPSQYLKLSNDVVAVGHWNNDPETVEAVTAILEHIAKTRFKNKK